MKIVAQMDHIASININTDTTFLLLLEAQKRGHEIFYYLPSELNFELSTKRLSAVLKKIHLRKELGNHYDVLESKEHNLSEVDVILVRQDPPFDMNYITSTYLLEKVQNQVLVLNNPVEIRNCPEKIFISDFPDLIAPTLISSSLEQIEKFRQQHENIILKPIYACGGEGIVLLKKEDLNLSSIVSMMLKTFQTPLIAQKFLPEIKNGDRRIILLNGKILGGIARLAKSGEIRSNLHIGGYAKKLEFSKRELEICNKIAPELKKRGLFLVGIDVIGDYLTEINVTSPTCIPEINFFNEVNLEEQVLDEIEAELKKKRT